MNEKKHRRDDRIFEEYYETPVQSATDLTGLTPTPPLTEEEEDSYSELMPDTGFGLRKPLREEKWFD